MSDVNHQVKPAATIKQTLRTAVESLDTVVHSDANYMGIETGLTNYDELIAGLMPGELLTVAGRTGHGKSSFAQNIAEAVATSGGLVSYHTNEKDEAQTGHRLMASLGRVPYRRIRSGRLADDDWPRMNSATEMLADMELFIDTPSSISTHDLKEQTHALAADKGRLSLIVVDSLQAMYVPGFEGERTEELSQCSRELKTLARELKAPVVVTSNISHRLDNRPNKRPVLSDLNCYGAISEESDIVTFIYRDELYNEDTEDKGIAEIIVGKNRNGPVGTVRVAYLDRFQRFENLATESE